MRSLSTCGFAGTKAVLLGGCQRGYRLDAKNCCWSLYFLLLLDLLAREVLDLDDVELHAGDTACDFCLDLLGGGVVAKRELADLLDGELGVVLEMAAAKDNRAAHVGRPLALLVEVAAKDGEADLVALGERIDLVTLLGAVEVDAVLARLVEVVERQRKGGSLRRRLRQAPRAFR